MASDFTELDIEIPVNDVPLVVCMGTVINGVVLGIHYTDGGGGPAVTLNHTDAVAVRDALTKCINTMERDQQRFKDMAATAYVESNYGSSTT